MTSLQKEALYIKWNTCDRDTRIRLACEFLKFLRAGEKNMSWLRFLENNLEKNLVASSMAPNILSRLSGLLKK